MLPPRLLLTAALALFALLAPAGAALAQADRGEREEGSPAERLREQLGARKPPSRFAVPAGTVRVSPNELVAGGSGRIAFTVALDRRANGASLQATLPVRWTRRAASGLRFAGVPRLLRSASGRARLRRSGRTVRLDLGSAVAGSEAAFEVENVGLEAGTYRLRLEWREASGATTPAGTARVAVYAPRREGLEHDGEEARNAWSRLSSPGIEENSSADSEEESETFISVSPADSDRILTQANQITGFDGAQSAWLSNDAGQTFAPKSIPQVYDLPGTASTPSAPFQGDPMSAADPLGNLWFGGMADLNFDGGPDRIVVNRIAAGSSSFQPLTTALPIRNNNGIDKPLMTIDATPSSPTYGTLYVVWDDFAASGAVRIVISQCDTRPNGLPDAVRCDNADNWSAPAQVTQTSDGNFIYADVAVGPDGRVYVTWWHFGATNAIEGDVCDPGSLNCASAAGWQTPSTIATLDSFGGNPLPFACPIVAQPGGRVGPEPQVAVDTSGGPNDGRVYVTWGDLRSGSGTTRCEVDEPNPFGTPPLATHLTWDVFVASAPGGSLPGGSAPSTTSGQRLYTDTTEGTTTTNSDEWFSAIAVDPSNGQAWADFYSTRDAASRQTTNFYARSVTPTSPSATTHTLGTLTRLSTTASNYSNSPCCDFGNDYGDYTGIDAAEGAAFPVWTQNNAAGTADGEAYTFVPSSAELNLLHSATTVTEAPGADGDGRIDPGEPVDILEQVRNPTTVGATGVSGAITTAVPGVSISQPTSAYPNVSAGGLATNTTAFRATLPSSMACGASVDLLLTVASGQSDAGGERVAFLVPTQCDPTDGGGGTGGGGTTGGTGGGTTGGGTVTPPRTTPPRITVRFSRSQKLTTTGVITINPTFDEDVAYALSGNLTTKFKVSASARKRTRTTSYGLKRVTGTATAGLEVTIKIKLSQKLKRAISRALARSGSAVVKLKLLATDAAGRSTTGRLTVKAKKAKKKKKRSSPGGTAPL